MYYLTKFKQQKGIIKNSILILFAFATVFFPGLLENFGAPGAISFVHFAVVPVTVGLVILNTRVSNNYSKVVVDEIGFSLLALLTFIVASATLNMAGIINAFISFMLLAEPVLILLAFMAIKMSTKSLEFFRKWLLIFAASNLGLAISQSILLPIGIYPRPQGGTLQDNITGVFAGGGGSAGNYVSCTISFYFALYLFLHFKTIPRWIKVAVMLASIYQIQISDSKQVIMALLGGGVLLACTKIQDFRKFFLYAILMILLLWVGYWAIYNLDFEFLGHYRNWLDREGIYGPNGEATLTKTAAFRIVPTHYKSVLNWLLGLGPGHSVSRLGGWILRDYARLLMPLGATVHPASAEVFNVVTSGWIAQESTVYFPLFTWAGIWGDFGFLGLGSYLFLIYVVWQRCCVDDYSRFLLLSTACFGFILTQMEEPGHVLTVAMLIGLRWHEAQNRHEESTQAFDASALGLRNPYLY